MNRRLARGEIDRTEYDEIRDAMAWRPPGGARGRRLPTSGLIVLIVLGVIVAFGFTSMALTYGPWRTPQSGTPSQDGGGWSWQDCCVWGGGTGGMGGGMMGGNMREYGSSDVVIANYAFTPAVLAVATGTTVIWVNMDHVMHTVSFGEHGEDHAEEAVDSGPLYHMDSWSHTFDEPGVYQYHCDPHPSMTGTVIVEG